MEKIPEEKRVEKRRCLEPSDTGQILEAELNGRRYRFKILNICNGGIGMLVNEEQTHILKGMKKGAKLEMNYINPKGSLAILVEIRHITLLTAGPHKGGHIVGFSITV